MKHLQTLRTAPLFTAGLLLGACSTPQAEPSTSGSVHDTAAQPAPSPAKVPVEPAAAGGPLASMPDQAPAPAGEPAKAAEPTAGPHPGLLDPQEAVLKAPERYTVSLATTQGDVLIDVRRSWAPIGADRFYNLVKIGAFDDIAFFRVVSGFMAQFGIPGDPAVSAAWRRARIDDDPVTQSNRRGTISFATSGPHSRVNQVFINLVDNGRLDAMGFAPFGVVRDMQVVDQLHSGYGEGAPAGRGPMQARIQREGNAYLRAEFPELDYVRSARVIDEVSPPPQAPPRLSH